MVWLATVALLVAIAIGAVVAVVRGGRSQGGPVVATPPAAEPVIERRRPAPVAPPPAERTVGERLRDAVARQRERAGRLTAGHVQLIDVGAMIAGAPAAGLSPAKALAVAEEVARRMIRPADVLVRMDPDGLAILFDGADRDQAEERSRRIAEATLTALGEVGSGGRYLAEGFGYELDEVLDGAVVDTVDDLIRFVHIAHRAYVAKQRGVARQLEQEISLVPRVVLAAAGTGVIGHEIAVFRSVGDGGRVALREAGFAKLDAALGAETDCVVFEKLAAAAAPVMGEGTGPIYVPVRLTTIVNPLYLDNLRAALDALPPALRQRLVPVVEPGEGPSRQLLPKVRELLRTRVAGIAARIGDPAADVAAAAAAGVAAVVLDAPERRFEKPAEAVSRLRAGARDAGVDAIVFGAGPSIAGLPGGVAHSRDGYA